MPPKLDDHATGSRVTRITRRPHEIRVYLLREVGKSVWLHFWPATEAIVDLLLPDATVTHTTVERENGRSRVRLWAEDRVLLVADAERYSWHPYSGEEACLWSLALDEKAAVERAVAAVVARDVKTVATLLRPNWGSVEEVWRWVDDYGNDDDPGARLLMPPPPFDDWDGSVLPLSRGKAVYIEFLDAVDPQRSTDLTLELYLTRTADGTPKVQLDNLHVM